MIYLILLPSSLTLWCLIVLFQNRSVHFCALLWEIISGKDRENPAGKNFIVDYKVPLIMMLSDLINDLESGFYAVPEIQRRIRPIRTKSTYNELKLKIMANFST